MIPVARETDDIFMNKKFPTSKVGKDFFKIDPVWIKIYNCPITLLMRVDHMMGWHVFFNVLNVGKFS